MYYFASDIHLGLSFGEKDMNMRERLFVKWLDEVSVDAKAIFLVGDVFDFWFEYKWVIPRGFARLFGKLAELTDRGVEIHLFVGNHDLWAFDYLRSECGLILHHGPYEIMDLCGRRVVIGHGDVLGRRGIVGKVLSGMFRSRMVQWFFSLLHPDIAIAFGYRWSGSNRKAKPVKHSFRAEDEPIVGFARDFLREQPVDLFVCGHIHCAEIYPLTDVCSIVFLGEWIENPVYGVLNETGFELKTYSGTNEVV